MSMDKFTSDTAMALMNATQGQKLQAMQKVRESTLSDKTLKAIEDAAQDFEAVFISEMMRPMFESVEVNSEFGGGKGEEIFRSFLIDEYGKITAATGQIGIAEHVKHELIRLQEGQMTTSIDTPVDTPTAKSQPDEEISQ